MLVPIIMTETAMNAGSLISVETAMYARFPIVFVKVMNGGSSIIILTVMTEKDEPTIVMRELGDR